MDKKLNISAVIRISLAKKRERGSPLTFGPDCSLSALWTFYIGMYAPECLHNVPNNVKL